MNLNVGRLARAIKDTGHDKVKDLSVQQILVQIKSSMNLTMPALHNPYTLAIFFLKGEFIKIKEVSQETVDFARNVNDRYYHNY